MFIEKYAANISQGGMFIQSRAPQPVGTHLRFEVLLADDSRLLKGEGKVIWVREYDAADPTQVHGMGVKFLDLDEESRSCVNFVLAHKDGQGSRKKSATQEVKALVREALTENEEPDETATPDAEAEEEEVAPELAPTLLADSPEPAPPEPAPPEPEPAEPAPPEPEPVAAVDEPEVPATPVPLRPVLDVVDSGGDGVAVSLAAADQALSTLMEEATISEAAVATAMASALHQVAASGAALEGLEDLVTHEPPPPVAPEEAMAILHQQLGASPVVAPARWTPPPAPKPQPVDEPEPQPVDEPEPLHLDENIDEPEPQPVDEPEPQPVDEPAPLHLDEPEPQHLEFEQEYADPTPHEQHRLEQHETEPLPPPTGPNVSLDKPDDFDPRLLTAAAHVSRATRSQSERNFDLSAPPQEEMEEDGFVQPPAAEESLPSLDDPPPDGGWKNLETSTEWLDHGSSDVLQDLASKAAKRANAEVDDGYHEALGNVGEDEIDDALAMPQLQEQDPGADQLSGEMWREVAREAAEVSDPGSVPAVEVDEDMIEADLSIDPDFNEEHTLVSGVPAFNGRVDPTAFDERANGDLLPADNIFPSDPDLNNEVFDALAGLEEQSEPQPPPDQLPEPSMPAADVPSLDDLAEVAHQPPPLELPSDIADVNALQVVADDPELPDADPEAKPKSGLFRRLFGKKKE